MYIIGNEWIKIQVIDLWFINYPHLIDRMGCICIYVYDEMMNFQVKVHSVYKQLSYHLGVNNRNTEWKYYEEISTTCWSTC